MAVIASAFPVSAHLQCLLEEPMSTLPNTADRSLISGFLRLDAPAAHAAAASSVPYPLDPARVAEFNAIIQSVAPGAPAVDAALIAAMANELLGDAAVSCSASVR